MLEITLVGEAVHLLGSKSLYWPRRETLFIADPHWGKAAAFRASGIAIASEPLDADLGRLSGALRESGARRLVVLGDLFHARAGKSPGVLRSAAAWRAGFATLEVLLVRGNHDRGAGDPPGEWRFDCRAEPVLEPPFAFRHFPNEVAGHYALAGHVHPAVTLRGEGRDRLRLPAFRVGQRVAVLPAFGSFTGTAEGKLDPGDRAFAVAEGEVIEVRRGGAGSERPAGV